MNASCVHESELRACIALLAAGRTVKQRSTALRTVSISSRAARLVAAAADDSALCCATMQMFSSHNDKGAFRPRCVRTQRGAAQR